MATTSGPEPAIPQIEGLSHTRLSECYQCGKCTAGCPVAGQMDIPPTRLIRLLQLGDSDSALRASSIWQCVSCQTCTTRCPKSVDCAGVLDALRQLAFERGTASPDERRTVLFQKAFLDNIRRHGRLNEIELIAAFKGAVFLRDRSLRFLFSDAGLAPQLQKRGKLHLIGEQAKDRGVVARIFARAQAGTQAGAADGGAQ
jgi:heterodisulfide reductase subunit C